jgi:hypothetical protein
MIPDREIAMLRAERDVPKAQWHTFLAEINRRYAGCLANLEVRRPDGTPFAEAFGLPLDLTVGDERVTLGVGRPPAAVFRHEIDRPSRVLLEKAPGERVRFRIQAADGSVAIVEIRPEPGYPHPVVRRFRRARSRFRADDLVPVSTATRLVGGLLVAGALAVSAYVLAGYRSAGPARRPTPPE